MRIKCIANNGTNGEPEVPLWECPCLECTRMQWEAEEGWHAPSLRDYRRQEWPKTYA